MISGTSDVFGVTAPHGKTFPVEYSITNAKVQNMIIDPACFCMVVVITDAQDFGMLTLNLPRALLD